MQMITHREGINVYKCISQPSNMKLEPYRFVANSSQMILGTLIMGEGGGLLIGILNDVRGLL